MDSILKVQLNNINGDIIRIFYYNKETKKTIYTHYENIVLNDDGGTKYEYVLDFQKVKILNVDYSQISGYPIEEAIEMEFYKALQAELGSAWAISEDVQNWIFPTKPIRVIINNTMSNWACINNPSYRALYNAMLDKHAGFIEVGNENTKNAVIYVNSLDPLEMDIIKNYLNVWIFTENKL